MSITCPVCGSENLEKSAEKTTIPIEFGRDITIDETIYKCLDCDFDGDFAKENDSKIEHALTEAKKNISRAILEELSISGISNTHFERTMGLPFRTLARWKKGHISASGYALLKTVKTYPWLLSVADEKFDSTYAAKALIGAAINVKHPQIIISETTTTNGTLGPEVTNRWGFEQPTDEIKKMEGTTYSLGLLSFQGAQP